MYSMDNGPVKFNKKKVYCIECGEEIPEGVKFCINCGTSINRSLPASGENLIICPECNIELPIKMRFCTNCGTKVGIVAGEVFSECPKCGAVANPGQRFCTECGESFDRITSAHISNSLKTKRRKRKFEEDKGTINEYPNIEIQKLESKIFGAVDEVIDSAVNAFKMKSRRNKRLNRKKRSQLLHDD